MSNITPAIIPDIFVLPPALIFTTVLMVAPAPGIPPKTDAILFPIPCPINSLLGLCLVLVILSATTLVSSESIDPKRAKVSAVRMYGLTVFSLKEVKISTLGIGKSVGISSIEAYSKLNPTAILDTTTSATSELGILFVIRLNP